MRLVRCKEAQSSKFVHFLHFYLASPMCLRFPSSMIFFSKTQCVSCVVSSYLQCSITFEPLKRLCVTTDATIDASTLSLVEWKPVSSPELLMGFNSHYTMQYTPHFTSHSISNIQLQITNIFMLDYIFAVCLTSETTVEIDRFPPIFKY